MKRKRRIHAAWLRVAVLSLLHNKRNKTARYEGVHI
jgi:hypothetical protein